MWASQMGSFMAQSFQFIYSNVCCALCIRGRKRRAEAASKLRKERRQHEKLAAVALAAASEKLGAAMLEVGSAADSAEKGSGGGGDVFSMTNKSLSNAGSSNPIDCTQKDNIANRSICQPVFPNQQLHNNITVTLLIILPV